MTPPCPTCAAEADQPCISQKPGQGEVTWLHQQRETLIRDAHN